MTWHLPEGYRERLTPSYTTLVRGAPTVCQPDVYPAAATALAKAGLTTLVDIGCGTAEKLVALPGLTTIGVDYGKNIVSCRKTYPDRTWMECDFETMEGLTIPGPFGVVCADVVEHLKDPTALLRWLAQAPAPVIVLSTPDRRAVRKHDLGPPKSHTHVREWSMVEFVMVLRDFGLVPSVATHTRSNTNTPRKWTSLFIMERPC